MLRPLWLVGIIAAAAAAPGYSAPIADQKTWQENQLKKLGGSWTTFQDEQDAKGKPLRRRVDLEFADGRLKVNVYNEDGAKRLFDGELTVLGAEELEGPGLGNLSRLNLGGSPTQKAEVYYDLVGEKLILVGRVGWRPWEGFHLSGEYARPEKPK